MGKSQPTMFVFLLQALKLGSIHNGYLLFKTFAIYNMDYVHIIIPAQILLAVSIYRCIFPIRYKNYIVLHDSPISSIFWTRVLATFSEIAWIYQLSAVLRDLNHNNIAYIDLLSWLMVLFVCMSQCFVWLSILTRRYGFMFWEELGWGFIFIINTQINIYYWFSNHNFGKKNECIIVSSIFGLAYIPWQFFFHIPIFYKDMLNERKIVSLKKGNNTNIKLNFYNALFFRNHSVKSKDWGGMVGIVWMVGYWVGIPYWMFRTVELYSHKH
eukprot:70241_1